MGVSTSTLFALLAEVSEPGPLLQGKCALRVPSGGAGRKTALGGVKSSTSTAESEPGESMSSLNVGEAVNCVFSLQ